MAPIEAGQVRNRENGREEFAELMRLEAGCCREILTLQHEVAAGIATPGSYYALSEEEVMAILDGLGLAVGVRVEGRLVAFGTVLFPGSRADNLGRDFGLSEAELGRVAHLEAAVVHPEYRGNALQKKLGHFLITEICAAKRWRYLMNTVSPFNTPSLKTTLALGLLIRKLKVKYNDVLRYIFCRDLVKPVIIDTQNVKRIPVGDLSSQQETLENGYYGFALESQTDGGAGARASAAVILYGKEALR